MTITVAVLEWLSWVWLLSVAGMFLLLCGDAVARRLWGRGISPTPPEGGFGNTLRAWAIAPFLVTALALAAAVSIPYFWLYPERHVTMTEFEGSAEEREALAQHRAAMSRKSFRRRLVERLGRGGGCP